MCNLRTSEIPNCITYEDKRLESNCSGVNKNGMNKIDNFCNTLQKLRVSNPDKNKILSHLHAISKALDDLSKKNDNFVLLGDFNN